MLAPRTPRTHRTHRPPTRWSAPLCALLAVTALLAGLVLALVPAPPARAAVTLLSQGRPVTASSTENAGTPASAAVDGDPGTRWSSAAADPQWIQVDLGSSQAVSQVVLRWETAAAKSYRLQTSNDGATWTSLYSTTTGTGGTQTLDVTGTGR
ncbi:discoidin domain-containing protein, partial [Kitasatospora phosalacinea]|uniref:discoidin domain-containing protein n=1 Tax=Kitasatospora phosalacinea TaxID=2065 RepID=UPI000524A94B